MPKKFLHCKNGENKFMQSERLNRNMRSKAQNKFAQLEAGKRPCSRNLPSPLPFKNCSVHPKARNKLPAFLYENQKPQEDFNHNIVVLYCTGLYIWLGGTVQCKEDPMFGFLLSERDSRQPSQDPRLEHCWSPCGFLLC